MNPQYSPLDKIKGMISYANYIIDIGNTTLYYRLDIPIPVEKNLEDFVKEAHDSRMQKKDKNTKAQHDKDNREID